MDKFLNRIHCADARKFLKKLPSESVDCVVTSPPYA
jgi:DNA modification methylase